jgi:hypothetical protein
MQIGIITIAGRKVGIISLTEGSQPDTTIKPNVDGFEPEAPGADEPIGFGGAPDGRAIGHGHDGDHQIGHSHGSDYQHHEGRPTAGPVAVGKGEDPRGLEPYIREEATKYGHDPDTAVRVAKSEGLRDPIGDQGTSFGAFQLHKHGGLGDEFQKETGLDPADPKNERAGISWALKNLGRTGWSPYHGAARVGVSKWDGVGQSRNSATAAPNATPVDTGPVRDQTAPPGLKGDDVAAFIVHHTGGRGTPEGVQNTLNQRGLGVEYIMDREGNITVAGGRNSAHMLKGWGKGEGLSNRNTVGMEVIAKDNDDVTPAQIRAGKAFIDRNYSNIPVYGHGEVNPGHKEADEGMGIVNAVRSGRQNAEAMPAAKPFDPETMTP